jgi:hypothetical protein
LYHNYPKIKIKINIHRTTILPIVLFDRKTLLLTLREECRLRVFENRGLRRIFGPNRDEVTEEWRRLHDKELYALYSSPNIIRVIKSKRLRWARHVTRMGESSGTYRGLVGKREGRGQLENSDVEGRIILKWIFERLDGGVWTGSVWLRIGTGGGLL